MKMKNIAFWRVFSRNILATFLFMFLFLTNNALAEDRIDVEYPVGTNIGGNEFFDEDNIYPGWEKTRTLRVENNSETDDVDFYITFDVKGDKTLAKKLKLYVIRKADGSYRLGGEGDRMDLDDADEKELYVDRLSPTKGKEYDIKIKFDKEAGNKYQGKEVEFDTEFMIESRVASDETEEEILAAQGREDFTGLEPEVQGESEVSTETTPEAAQISQEGQVEGAQAQCESWPMWAWIVLLIVLLVMQLLNEFRNYNMDEYHWKFSAFLPALGIALWYLFDNCLENTWFVYACVIGFVLIHLVYMNFLKKNSKQ